MLQPKKITNFTTKAHNKCERTLQESKFSLKSFMCFIKDVEYEVIKAEPYQRSPGILSLWRS